MCELWFKFSLNMVDSNKPGSNSGLQSWFVDQPQLEQNIVSRV